MTGATYVLIWVITTGSTNAGPTSGSAYFAHRDLCEAARTEVVKMRNGSIAAAVDAKCFPVVGAP